MTGSSSKRRPESEGPIQEHDASEARVLRVSVTEARRRLARLLEAVQASGEVYEITRHGRPVAVLRPARDTAALRTELGETWERAVAALGSARRAEHWLLTPNRVLAGRTPRDVAALGEPETVTELLGRIEHGIIS